MAQPLNRRSFLTKVMGVAILGGGATAAVAGAAHRAPPGSGNMIVDADPSDPARPPSANSTRSGCSDSDSGSSADPPGAGRRCGSRNSGISDSDSGPNADPPNMGRGTAQARSRFIICPGHPRCPPRD